MFNDDKLLAQSQSMKSETSQDLTIATNRTTNRWKIARFNMMKTVIMSHGIVDYVKIDKYMHKGPPQKCCNILK